MGRIVIASYSKLIYIAAQTALLNLYLKFNILPAAVVGHSSGSVTSGLILATNKRDMKAKLVQPTHQVMFSNYGRSGYIL